MTSTSMVSMLLPRMTCIAQVMDVTQGLRIAAGTQSSTRGAIQVRICVQNKRARRYAGRWRQKPKSEFLDVGSVPPSPWTQSNMSPQATECLRAHHHSQIRAILAVCSLVKHNVHKLIETAHDSRHVPPCIQAHCTVMPGVTASAIVAVHMPTDVPLSRFSMKLRSSGCCGFGMFLDRRRWL